MKHYANVKCSVVAVHGLNFKDNKNHPVVTWAGSSKTTPWVQEFLPSALQRPCRVMLFAYNSSPAMGAEAVDLDDHARFLLRCLQEKREVPLLASISGVRRLVGEKGRPH